MRKKMKSNIIVKSIVAADMVLEGNLNAKESARIDGNVKGFVHSESTLIIGPTGKIQGNVHAANIYIAGEVQGDLIAGEKIEVSATGKIYGDIITKSLVIDESAIFQGKCEMNIIPAKEEVKENKDTNEKIDEKIEEKMEEKIQENK